MNSVRDLYVCTHPVDARDRLQEEIDRFYRGGEGRGWLVDNPRPGRFYAAPYEQEGYHRALLRKLVSNSTVEVFYVDFGSSWNHVWTIGSFVVDFIITRFSAHNC